MLGNCVICINDKLNKRILVSKCLTLQFVVFRVRRKGPVREILGEADARILRLVHHVVPHGLHQSVHKLQTGRAQNLNHLIPLVDVWTTRLLWRTQLHYGHVHVSRLIRHRIKTQTHDIALCITNIQTKSLQSC